jgi:GDP-4-dehydro-6-deoxy-D-mannose reductase
MACDVYVTGARGFVGRHALERARAAGLTAQAAAGDLRDAAAVDEQVAAARPGAVLHLAATPRGGDPWRALADDIAMTGAVLGAVARHAPGAPVLVAGSAAQYGMGASRPLAETGPAEPVSAYGALKSVVERAVTAAPLHAPLRVIFTRAFNHIGPGQGTDAPAAQWARQMLEAEAAGGGAIRTGDLDVIRDFLDVRDVADAYLALVRSPDAQGVVNVCSGVPVAVRQVAELVAAHSAVPVALEHDPALARSTDPPYVVGDPQRLHALTGWAPAIALEQSLADLVRERRRGDGAPAPGVAAVVS